MKNRLVSLVTAIIREGFSQLNKCLPKFGKVVIESFPNIEGSAIEVHNYLKKHKDITVYFVIDTKNEPIGEGLLLDPILIKKSSLRYFYHYLTAQIIFFTHGSFLNHFSDRQVVVNIWHGMCLKPVGRIVGDPAISATLTAATSEFTKPMFMKSFGVPYESIVGSGYPRNDIFIREKKNKKEALETLEWNYSKIIIWLPTFRKNIAKGNRKDGGDFSNPFYLQNFDLEKFNNFLEEYSILCIVKPHPLAPSFPEIKAVSNIKFIDDTWLASRNITLYHLVSWTDLLISDISSIVADYTLLDQPIVCVSEDFEEYRRKRGFYFDDIENWLPCKICRNSDDLIFQLKEIIISGKDPYEEKRLILKDYFFDIHDGSSTRLLVEKTFEMVSSRL